MKAPLSQHFKLNTQNTYKRTLFEDSNPASGRDLHSRPSQLQNLKTESDYFQRRATPTQQQEHHQYSRPNGGDYQNRTSYLGLQTPQELSTIGSNYRSIQHPTMSHQYRSPNANQPTSVTSAGGHRPSDSYNHHHMHTSSSRDEDIYTAQNYHHERQGSRNRGGFDSLNDRQVARNNYLVNNSVEQTGKFQPQQDYSPQILNKGSRGYSASRQDDTTGISRFNPMPLNATRQDQQVADDSNLNNDLSQIILSLHSKMKNLESKYIDLANFYKKELVTHKTSLDLSPYGGGSRSKSPIRHSSELMDQTVEKAIIAELVQEKGELEKELKVMVDIQQRMLEDEQRMHDRVERVEKELRGQKPKSIISSNNAGQINGQQIESLKQQVQQLLNTFEDEFLDFINQNYQNFTEQDVQSLFGSLKTSLLTLLDQMPLKQDSYRAPFQPIQQQNQDSRLKKQVTDSFTKDYNEFELNQQYAMQNLKKAVFELKNKHDTTKLDLKKVQITLAQLQASSQELSHTNTTQTSFDRPGSSQLKNQKMIELLPSPHNSSNRKTVSDIQGQVQVLSQCFQTINRKLTSSEVDLKLLGEIELDCLNNLENLKDSYSMFIKHFDKQPQATFRINSTITTDENEDLVHQHVQKQLIELKILNDKLQRDLHLSSDKFNNIKLENQHLQSQLDQSRVRSPFTRAQPSISSHSSIQEENHQSQKLQILETENQSLTRRIRTLTRTLDEKQGQIENLGKNFKSIDKQRPQQVSLDQLQFYQRSADMSQDKTRQLVRLTQRFLLAMKKLQKAVHRKEPNVQKEKTDFENTRKELEIRLKDLKKELEPNEDKQARGSALRGSSLGDRNISSDEQPTIKTQIHKYQNKVPNTMSARNDRPTKQPTYQPSVNQSLGQSSVLYDNNRTMQERSPVPLRTKLNVSSRNSHQQEMFHSIEAVDRKHHTLLGSNERPAAQGRSPSHEPFGRDPTSSLTQTLQVNNMKNEIELLRQEIQDLMIERENLNSKVARTEREKDGVIMERQKWEKQYERERKKVEAAQREINDIELEKESLIEQLKRQQFAPLTDQAGVDPKQLQEAQDQAEKLYDQLQIIERINQEYQRTISFLEDSAEAAKHTITELKEALNKRELDSQSPLHHDSEEAKSDPALIQWVRDKIEEIETIWVQRLSEIEDQVEHKEEEISKVKRLIERKLKEKEMQRHQSESARILELQTEIVSLYTEVQTLREQPPRPSPRFANELQTQMQSQKVQYEQQLGQVKLEHQQQLQMLQSNEQENLELMLQQRDLEHQNAIYTLNQENIQALQKAKDELAKLKSSHSTDVTQLQNQLEVLEEAKQELEAELERERKRAQEGLGKEAQDQMRRLEEQLKKRWEKEAQELQQTYLNEQQELQEVHDQEKEELETQIESLKKDCTTKDKSVVQSKLQAQGLETQLNSLRAQYEQAQSELQTQLSQEKEQAVRDKDRELVNLKQLHQKSLEAVQKQLSGRDKEILDLKTTQAEQEDSLRRMQTDGSSQSQSLNQQLDQAKSQLKLKDQELKDSKKRVEELQAEVSEWQGQCDEAANIAQTKEEQLRLVQIELSTEKQRSQRSLTELQGKLDKATRAKDELNQELEALRVTEVSINHQLQQEKQTAADLKAKLAELTKVSQTRLSQLQSQYQELQSQYDLLKQDKDLELSSKDQELTHKLQSEQSLKDELKTKLAEMLKSNQRTILEKQQEHQSIVTDLENDRKDKEDNLSRALAQIDTLTKTAREQEKLMKAELTSKDTVIRDLQQSIQDNKNEIEYVKNQRQSLQNQLDKAQMEHQDKDKAIKAARAELAAQLQQQDALINEKEQEIEAAVGEINDLETKYETLQAAATKQLEELNQHHTHELTTLRSQFTTDLDRRDGQVKELHNEKARLQDQLKSLLEQQTAEKSSREGQLQKQLNETMQALQAKEHDADKRQQDIELKEQQLRDKESEIERLNHRVKELGDDLETVQEENQALDEQRQKHQQTLEANRNLIQMLKNELEKSIEKQKQLSDKSEADKETLKLREQIHELRQQFEDKFMDQKLNIDTLEEENRSLKQLMDEVNPLIEEFNNEKHELKAKFKHLAQILDDVDVESSYKEEDSIDVGELFDRFEKEFLRSKRNFLSKLESLEKENSLLKDQVKFNKEEMQLLETNMTEVRREMDRCLEKANANTEEMKKQLETAQRKMQNYKDKLIEKQKYINQIENQQKQQKEESKDSREPSLIKENLELLQKLQRAENDLQTYRLAGQSRQRVKTPDDSMDDNSLKVDIQRIQQIEDQLINLRKQLFQAKDQVLDQLSTAYSRRFKEFRANFENEKVLQAKLSEMKTEGQITALNSNIKLIKQVKFGGKTLLVVQVISNNEAYVIDEAKLTEGALAYVKSYLPDSSELETTSIMQDEQTQLKLNKLAAQIKEIREERQELHQELTIYKSKLSSGQAFEDMKDLKLIELEEETGHLTIENQEQRGTFKELLEKYHLLKLRIKEQNELIKDLTGKGDTDSANRKIIRLKEENDSLRNQLTAKKEHAADEDHYDGSFLKGIQVADNQNKSQQQEENLFDQSSLYGVIEGLDEGGNHRNTVDQLQKQIDDLAKTNRLLQSEIQRSQQQTLNPNEQSVIHHIKGTLIQFLKHTPITDKNNEELLAIIFSMMEFNKEEISEIQEYRKRQRNPSLSSGGNNPTDGEEEIKTKTKKGIFGLFGKKDKESSVSRRSDQDNQIISPARPLKRN